MKKREIAFLILILAIGIFFRFYLIKQMPGGLFPDEAANGLDINNIFKGHFLPFFARGNGREALFFYLEAISVYFFGRGPWQHHIVSAGIGVLSILGVWLLTRRLYGKRTALLAAFLMSVGTWHIVLSRTAFRAIQIPLFTTLTFYFMARTVQAKSQKEKIWSAIFSGFFFAGGFYTYIAYRIMVPIVGLLIAILLISDYKQKWIWLRENIRAFWIAIASAFVVFSPIGIYFLRNPDAFVGRSSQVSIFNPSLNHGHVLATFIGVVIKSIEAFFIHGDTNWRQNISGLPFLSVLVSPFFAIGLIAATYFGLRYTIKSFRGTADPADIKHLLMALFFWGMLLPVAATAEGIPHGLRSIGMLPGAYIFSALGLVYFSRAVLKIWHPKWMELIYAGLAIIYLAGLTSIAYVQYFQLAYNSPENFQAFDSDLTTVSNYINNTKSNKQRTYLVLDLYSLQTVDYLTTTAGNPYIVVDPANSAKIHLEKGDRVIFTQSTLYDFQNFAKTHENFNYFTQSNPRFSNETDMVVANITENDSSAASVSSNDDASFNIINFGDRIDFSWTNLSFNPWTIKIYQCPDAGCSSQTLIKNNQQNDYLSNNDYIQTDGTTTDFFFHAVGYDQHGQIIKDYGILKLQKYQN